MVEKAKDSSVQDQRPGQSPIQCPTGLPGDNQDLLDKNGNPKDDGWIYDGVSANYPYRGAKYYLDVYNFNSTNYDALGQVLPPFTVETKASKFGPGNYSIRPRVKGEYKARVNFSISSRLANQKARENNNHDNNNDHSNNGGNGNGNGHNGHGGNGQNHNMSGSERIKHVMADAMEFKMAADYLGLNKGDIKDKTLDEIIKAKLMKDMDRDSIKEITTSLTGLQSLAKLFGGNNNNGGPKDSAMDIALAECIPEIMQVVKYKMQHSGNGKIKDADYEVKNKSEETNMTDIQYVIRKLYAMAKADKPVEDGVALISVTLGKNDLKVLLNANPEQLISSVVEDYPDMKEFLESEKGRLWITNLLEALRKFIKSRVAKLEAKKK